MGNGLDVTRMPQNMWIIDFPPGMSEDEAMFYEQPYEYLRRHGPTHACHRTVGRQNRHQLVDSSAPRPEMRIALASATAHRCSASGQYISSLPGCRQNPPDCQLIVFARDDDWFFGVLHSALPPNLGLLCLGTQLREKDPGSATRRRRVSRRSIPLAARDAAGKLTRAQDAQRTAIAQAARSLDAVRSRLARRPLGSNAYAYRALQCPVRLAPARPRRPRRSRRRRLRLACRPAG